MPARPFALSTTLVAVLAATAFGCGEDSQSPTEPGAASSHGPAAAATTAATYTVKELGTLGGQSAGANGINDEGGVVGWSELPDGHSHAFLWRAGKMHDLGALAGGKSEATAINDSDVVVGWSTLASGAQRAVRWQNGKITNLGSLGGRNSQATAINDLGVIVGWSETGNGKTHAFVWQNGTMRDLGTLGGEYSEALGINRAGKIVGRSSVASGESHAFTWKNGVFKDLGTDGHQGAAATAINTKGQIAGEVGPFPDAVGEELDQTYPFIFYQDTWTLIPGGGLTNETHAINNDGLVVGSAYDLRDDTFREDAWVSRPGARDILPPLTPGGIDENLANDINSFGTIVGMSTEVNGNYTGPNHAVLWRRQ
jgi:probable HAF family extracellular repeat protein